MAIISIEPSFVPELSDKLHDLTALTHNLDCILRKIYGLRMLQLTLVVQEKLLGLVWCSMFELAQGHLDIA
jgi:hypothetical protein